MWPRPVVRDLLMLLSLQFWAQFFAVSSSAAYSSSSVHTRPLWICMNVYAAFFDIHHAVFNELFFLINRESSPATCFFGVGGRKAVPPVLQAQHTAGSGDYSCSHRLSRLSFRRGATSAQKAKITRRFSISSLDYQRLSICVQQAEPHPSFFFTF